MVLSAKNQSASVGDIRDMRIDPWVRKIPWRRAWQPTLVLLPGELHGQRSLAGYSPCGCKELDMAEMTLHTCTHLLIGTYASSISFHGLMAHSFYFFKKSNK